MAWSPNAFSRRALLGAGLAGAALPLCGAARAETDARLPELRAGSRRVTLTAGPAPLDLAPGKAPAPAWLYNGAAFPVLRLRHGEPLHVTLHNRLAEHSSIHWHGVRTPNAMDGVPYLTQSPVQPGARFTYSFTPPDPGTYFFHPHCDTGQQFGRGLVGALVVEERGGPRFDDDVVLVLKDWRLDDDGSFLPFTTLQGASRAGTFGTLRTVNGRPDPTVGLPAGADVRLRLVNADPTRIAAIALEGAPAFIIAIDGNAVEPFPLKNWRLGPGMRIDLAVRTPATGSLRLMDTFAPDPVGLATLPSRGSPKRADAFAPIALPDAGRAPPSLSGALRHTLELGAGVTPTDLPAPEPITLPDGRKVELNDDLCLSSATLWTLDGQSWPVAGHRQLPPPLLDLRRGQVVELEYFNATPRTHPMHLHGHTVTVLSADRLKRPVHRADTVLVAPNERVRVAFVADNPGAWMIHCHIVEHQETGMMGWVRVS